MLVFKFDHFHPYADRPLIQYLSRLTCFVHVVPLHKQLPFQLKGDGFKI